jgi:hypothetical protein
LSKEPEKVLVDKTALMQLVGELRIAVNMSERFFMEMKKYIPYIEKWEKELYGDRVGNTPSES